MPEEGREGECSDFSQDAGSDEKGEAAAEAVTLEKKTWMWMELWERFHDIESTHDKMMGAYPNLDKTMTT